MTFVCETCVRLAPAGNTAASCVELVGRPLRAAKTESYRSRADDLLDNRFSTPSKALTGESPGGITHTATTDCEPEAPERSRPPPTQAALVCPVGARQRPVAPRAPPDADGLVPELDSASSDQLQELTYVDMDTFLATL